MTRQHEPRVKWIVSAKIDFDNDLLLASLDSEEEAQEFANKLQCGYEIGRTVVG